MKRIAFISDHASPLAALGGVDNGGQNVYVAELSLELAKAGYTVDIFTRKDNTLQPTVVNWQPGVRVVHIQAGPCEFVEKERLLPFMTQFAHNMTEFIRQEHLHYELIHAHFFMSGFVASMVKKKLRVPYVITFHALGLVRKLHQKEMDKFPVERDHIERFLVKDADGLIAECPQDELDLIDYYDADPAKIKIIPCGFNPAEFQPIEKHIARKRLNLSHNERIILQLGRMVPRKGVDNVIRALGKAARSVSNLRLVVVGGDTEQSDFSRSAELARLRAIAEQEKVLHRVTFAGRKGRDMLKYYYAAADIFITTPWYEPFGITPLEAMACGTPVIGASVGGIKYSVVHGQTGFLVPAKDPVILSAKIMQLINNPVLQATMSKESLKRVHRLFTWQRIARMVCQFYGSVTAKKAVASDYQKGVPTKTLRTTPLRSPRLANGFLIHQ